MICKFCKNEIPDGSIFCNWCGERQIKERKQKGEIKVPKPRLLPSGKWFIQLRINGQSIPVTEDTEAACKARAVALKAGLLGVRKSNGNCTLSHGIDKYIQARENILSPSTIRSYRDIQKNRFRTAMDDPIGKYNQEQWQKLCNMEAVLCSPKSVKNAWLLVSAVIFVETGIKYKVTLPQLIPRRIVKFLEPEQITVFTEKVKDTRFEIPALLALSSLRRSEIMSVSWKDIDFSRRLIHVNGAVVFNEHQELVQKTTNKNTSSRRIVPIMMDQLFTALKREKRSEGKVVNLHPNSLYGGINRICRDNNLPEVGIHGLRHSFASLAAHLGMPEKVTMEIGGWANNNTMRKIYTHVASSDKARYQNEMADYYNAN